MTQIFYSNAPLAAAGRPLQNYHKFNANAAYQRHYANILILRYLSQNAPDFNTRVQAREELEIAERKLAYAQKHPNCDMQVCIMTSQTLKQQFTPQDALSAIN